MSEIANDAPVVDTAAPVSDSAPVSTDSGVGSENLFAEFIPQDEPTTDNPDPLAAKPEGEAPGAETPKAAAVTSEEREIFERLKPLIEPESPNFKALRTANDALQAKYNAIKPLETYAAVPGMAENLSKLATGQIADGKEGWAAVQAIALPNVVADLEVEAFWKFAGTEKNADIIAKGMLGGHVTAEVLKKVAEVTNPANGTGYTVDKLFQQLSEIAAGEMTDAQLATAKAQAERDAAYDKRMADADAAQTKLTEQQTEADRKVAKSEIFGFVNEPLELKRTLFGFTPSPKDPPHIKELKEFASEMYDDQFNRIIRANPEAMGYVTSVHQLLDQDPKLKERANSMYSANLRAATDDAAGLAGARVNKFIRAYVNELKAGQQKGDAAPLEPGSLSGVNPTAPTPGADPAEWRRAYQAASRPNQ